MYQLREPMSPSSVGTIMAGVQTLSCFAMCSLVVANCPLQTCGSAEARCGQLAPGRG